jgi:diamine N-acetyltransferase
METFRLEELSATTALQANTLELVPGQEAFVTPATYEQADFDQTHAQPELRSCLWRVSVAAAWQGKGVGRFAIQAAQEEAAALGHSTLTAVWSSDEAGPGQFFHKLGFTDTGTTEYGDQIGTLSL